jgi:hypothetical protein
VRAPEKVVGLVPSSCVMESDGVWPMTQHRVMTLGTGLLWAVCTAVCSAVVLSGELSFNVTKVFSLGSRSTAP